MRYFIELAYNGKAYHGWQNQPNAITVQQVVEHALSTLLKEDVSIMGAGRTDAGVHAKQMFAHFDFDDEMTENFVFKLNQFLPKDIVVHDIFKVKEDAHTRFDATSRMYTYIISETKNPFQIDSAYGIKGNLDIDTMNEASKLLFNYKNFKAFSKVHTDVKTYNCKMMQAMWERTDNNLIFTIKADRFLRNMVRAIVGTMIDVGSGKIQLKAFADIIESQNRSNAGTSVPAHGLYLTEIEYPEDIFINGKR